MSARRAFVLTLMLVAACNPQKGASVVKTGTAADTAEQILYGVRAPITESGVKRGMLVADSMYVFNDQTRFHFFNGKVEFNTPTGAPNGSMTGNRGVYDTRTQVLEGWGNVVVKTIDGNSLRSPHVIYNQRADLITSDTSYTLVSGGRTQSGVGLTTDSHFKSLSCQRSCNTTGQVVIPK